MNALHVFPHELVLYILDMRMHYMKYQLKCLLEDEKLFINLIILFSKCYSTSLNQTLILFPDSSDVDELYDKTAEVAVQLGRKAMIDGKCTDTELIKSCDAVRYIHINDIRPLNTSLYNNMMEIKKIFSHYLATLFIK